MIPITFHAASGHTYTLIAANGSDATARKLLAERAAGRLTERECEEILDAIERKNNGTHLDRDSATMDSRAS